MDTHVVQSLEDLSFKASYKMILDTLLLCYDHRPSGNQFPWLKYSLLSSNSLLTSENLCNLIRSHLDHYLVGEMSEKIRYVIHLS